MSPFNSNGDEIVTTYVHNTAAINQFHKLNRSDWIRFLVCYSGHSTPTKRQFIEGSSLCRRVERIPVYSGRIGRFNVKTREIIEMFVHPLRQRDAQCASNDSIYLLYSPLVFV